MLMILGRTDSVVDRKEIEEDGIECLGKGNLDVVVVEGGHELPTSQAGEVVSAMLRFWGEDLKDVGLGVEFETGT